MTWLEKWRSPESLLMLMAVSGAASFALWTTLLNNFAVEKAAFTGIEMGVLQSVREIPGFLAFTAVYLILFISEQRLAYFSLLLLAFGTAITGFLPSFSGLLVTTTIMSIGFHYYETISQSLALQWLSKERAPMVLGRLIAMRSAAGIVTMAMIWLAFEIFGLGYLAIYALGGGLIIAMIVATWLFYPSFGEIVPQQKRIILRKRYWLYYLLTFMSGARRQIFVVFAGFLLVEKFGYSVAEISILYIVNAVLNIFIAPRIGRMIGQYGERRVLIIEYAGLVLVFVSYGLAATGWFAAVLYVIDHLFFAMAISIKTYFQKIADPGDMASGAAVTFTISHIAAVFIPVLFGLLWVVNSSAVFYAGAAMAACSLLLALLVPRHPREGHETVWKSEPEMAVALQ